MKTEDHAWQSLRDHASAQLRSGFADRVIRAANGASAESWHQLQAHAAAQLRPGFAERVLRAAREIKNVPSLFGQFALGAATVAVCLGAVLFVHQRAARQEEESALARWQQLAVETQDFDQSQ